MGRCVDFLHIEGKSVTTQGFGKVKCKRIPHATVLPHVPLHGSVRNRFRPMCIPVTFGKASGAFVLPAGNFSCLLNHNVQNTLENSINPQCGLWKEL